jgi:hypothetical protein
MPRSRIYLEHFRIIFKFKNRHSNQKLQADKVFSETSSSSKLYELKSRKVRVTMVV